MKVYVEPRDDARNEIIACVFENSADVEEARMNFNAPEPTKVFRDCVEVTSARWEARQ